MNRTTWFRLSIVLNVVLLGVVVFGIWGLRSPAPARLPEEIPTKQTAEASSATVSRPAGTVAQSNPGQLIDTLRAAGVSEKLLAEVAAADFEDGWKVRWNELQRKFKRGEVDGDAIRLFDLQHDGEEEKALRVKLGDEGFRRWNQERFLRDYDLAALNLSGSETDAFYELRRTDEKQRHDLAEAALRGDLDEAAYEKQNEDARSQFEKQARSLLGDDRYALVSDGADSASGDLKRALAAANPTDAQTAAVLQAQQQWNDQQAKLEQQLHDGKLSGAEYEQQVQAINTARDEEYQRQLGTNGFVALQKAQDNRYQLMQRYAPAWGLSESDINNLYDTIQSYESSVSDYQARAQAIEGQGQAVDWPAVQKALHEYTQQTEATLRNSLGEERFNKLKRNNIFAFGE